MKGRTSVFHGSSSILLYLQMLTVVNLVNIFKLAKVEFLKSAANFFVLFSYQLSGLLIF